MITRGTKKLFLVFGSKRICPFGNTVAEGSREMVASMTHVGENWQALGLWTTYEEANSVG